MRLNSFHPFQTFSCVHLFNLPQQLLNYTLNGGTLHTSIKSFVLDGLEQALANHVLGAKSSPLPGCLNKVLLEHSPELIHCHTYVCFHTSSLQQRLDGTQNWKYLLPVPFQKMFANPGLGCHGPHSTEQRFLILWGLHTVLCSPPPQQKMVAKVPCIMCMFLGKRYQ